MLLLHMLSFEITGEVGKYVKLNHITTWNVPKLLIQNVKDAKLSIVKHNQGNWKLKAKKKKDFYKLIP